MNRALLILTYVASFSINLFLAPKVYASEVSTDNVRQTGIVSTREVLTINNNESIYYDLNLARNAEAKIKLEVLDVNIVEPKNISRWSPFGLLFEVDNTLLDGFLDISTASKDGETNTVAYDTVVYRIEVVRDQGKYQAKARFDDSKKSTELFIKNNNKFHSVKHLRLKADFNGPGLDSNKIIAYFTYKITIEKPRDTFLIAKCKHLNFLPGFLYKYFIGNSNCIESISSENLSENVVEQNLNSQQQIRVDLAKNARELANLLTRPNWEKLKASRESNPEFYKDSYCRFKYEPYDNQIPSIAKAVYNWSFNWNPENYPENYVECTAFVHMVYNMIGISFKDKRLGDPINWPKRRDLFEVYESGKTSEMPEKGDIMVWEAARDNKYGHIGIVSEITGDIVAIINGNSTNRQYDFKLLLEKNMISIYSIRSKSDTWKPKYWLRLKL